MDISPNFKQREKHIEKGLHCRFCNAELSHVFLDLGMCPLSNSFLTLEQLKSVEPTYPLRTFVCNQCLLVQLEGFGSPEHIFSNYPYFSSYSESWLRHAQEYVNMMIRRFGFDTNSQIIEIASNDGYLLQYFKERNIPVLGIDPARNVAKMAEERGIKTITKFFGTKTAKELLLEDKQADLLIGNNVLAHVPNLNDFVAGMKILLKKRGIITMEFPHLLKLIEQNQFDTVYHEHFSYFSLFTAQKIFSYHNLTIFDVDELPTHGGSLRVFVKHEDNDDVSTTQNVGILIDREKQFGLADVSTYNKFAERVEQVKQHIKDFFNMTKKAGKSVVCYGAAAKGNTLLNYCGIGTDFVEYVADRSPYKQGLFLPGTHIPIKSPEKIRETKPDYLVILPWNLKDEIIEQMNYIRNWGGKFVVPIPDVKIYS